MRRWWIGLGVMALVAGCDVFGMGGGSEGSVSTSTTSGGTGSDGLGASGNLPPTSTTTGVGTEGCGAEDTAADPWGDEDGCGGGLPTQSPWDVGSGGSCWAQLDRWNTSCEEEPCLDYDCHSPSLCGPVTFGDCGGGGAGTTTDDGEATTGGSELEVDDPAALECILEALRDQVPISYTVIDCNSPEWTTTYEVVSNGLVITTFEEALSEYHFREQQISTFNDTFDFASCVGAGVANWEKLHCVGMSASGPCPVGPVACPGA